MNRFTRIALLLTLPALLVFMAACNDLDDDDDHVGDLSRVELETRVTPHETVLAAWTPNDGWTDGDGNAITELPDPIQDEGGTFHPMVEAGQNASLTVRMWDRQGNEIPMSTLERDVDGTRTRECSEYSARYVVDGNVEGVIAWPNIPHPESEAGYAQWAEYEHADDLVAIFHCDHIYFFPEGEGEVDVDFILWHNDHSDATTEDPLTVRVHAAEDENGNDE